MPGSGENALPVWQRVLLWLFPLLLFYSAMSMGFSMDVSIVLAGAALVIVFYLDMDRGEKKKG